MGNREKRDYKAIVEAVNLWKIYNEGESSEVKALQGVTLKVSEGEMVSIMGESGSGKTTLLNCISGIDKISKGDVFIAGENLALMGDNKKTRYRAKSMGFVFQTFNLIPVLTAVENVELPLLILGMKPKLARKKAAEFLDLVGLKDRLHHKPSELSGGQRQRVTIARALVNDPKVIWADEPTGNLDSQTAHEVMELFTKVNKDFGSTIVMVTHSDDIAKYTQRTIRMENGRVL